MLACDASMGQSIGPPQAPSSATGLNSAWSFLVCLAHLVKQVVLFNNQCPAGDILTGWLDKQTSIISICDWGERTFIILFLEIIYHDKLPGIWLRIRLVEVYDNMSDRHIYFCGKLIYSHIRVFIITHTSSTSQFHLDHQNWRMRHCSKGILWDLPLSFHPWSDSCIFCRLWSPSYLAS